MSDNKKYYYLKLKDNFFESDELKILQNYNSGKNEGYVYSDILLKMYLKSLKADGRLLFKERIPYDPSTLATVTNHSIGEVKDALEKFQYLGLVEILSSGEIFMNDIQLYVGKSSTEADRVRAFRKKIEVEKNKNSKIQSEESPYIEDSYICTPENRDKRLDNNNKDENLLLIDRFKELNSQEPNTSIKKQIKDWISRLTEAGSIEVGKLIGEAMAISHNQGNTNIEFWKVTVGILKIWQSEKVLSVKEARKQNEKTNSSRIIQRETLPDWAKESGLEKDEVKTNPKTTKEINEQLQKLRSRGKGGTYGKCP
ncbi:hypothetical protein FEZ51_07690 [Pediococcus stilesii]|uniref:Phage replisome organiser N-terminal domain-containing protein n=1 Tax=Pediococcus stilesii TaxID=331679 RepID=A0A5R9BU66_9LACO|nr:phage replisome organizer N-terminal domain-containing protein [Pediococcus stilesii]TLQ03783.1 hypothetical protein FEZ51_07690 [Pediococcus stilesii]